MIAVYLSMSKRYVFIASDGSDDVSVNDLRTKEGGHSEIKAGKERLGDKKYCPRYNYLQRKR